jgi:hypothetical protein
MREFQVRKDKFAVSRVVDTPALDYATLAEGEIVVRIDRFAYTANNITYAVLGDKLGYWHFFPPVGDNQAEWGVIPVWGFADVVASTSVDVKIGDRLFGYFPPATALKMGPLRVAGNRMHDSAVHRAQLPAGYNSYALVNREPHYDRVQDAARMLLWPLHLTSYCIWDQLQDNHWYGAKQIVILSASSKTSVGLGIALQGDPSAPTAIGFTSLRNRAFVQQLELFSGVLTYEELSSIRADVPTVIVDMAGNSTILGRLHTHLGDNMMRCINVGLTHWGGAQVADQNAINAQRSEFFFAPGHIQKRIKEWGPEVFAQKTSAFLKDSAKKSVGTIRFAELDGLEALQAVHADVCDGSAPPDQGLIVKMP